METKGHPDQHRMLMSAAKTHYQVISVALGSMTQDEGMYILKGFCAIQMATAATMEDCFWMPEEDDEILSTWATDFFDCLDKNAAWFEYYVCRNKRCLTVARATDWLQVPGRWKFWCPWLFPTL